MTNVMTVRRLCLGAGMYRIGVLLSALALSGCMLQIEKDSPPRPTPPSPAIAEHSWVADFAGEKAIAKRQFDDRLDRTIETMTLTNNGVIRYIKLKSDTFPGTYSDAEALRFDMDMPFFNDKKVRYDPSLVKSHGAFAYILASSESYNCLLLHANFGDGGGRGNQMVAGNFCALKTIKSAEAIEREMLDYALRLRINGEPVHKP